MKDERHININRDGDTISPWQSTISFHPLKSKIEPEKVFDTLIVGGGITGITTALLLQQSGKECLIAEAHNLGYGTTGGTTAHLNTFLDSTYPEIESDFGAEAAKLMAKGATDAISFIKSTIDNYGIDADFEYKDAYLFSQTPEETKQLNEILTASQNAGVKVSETSQNGVPIEFDHVLLFKEQAQFHPLKYLSALALQFQELGGIILENTRITDSKLHEGIHIAQSENATIKAKNIVYATHIPPGVNLLSLRNAPYRSYVLGLKIEGTYPTALAYDMKEPYHYFRTHEINGEQILIFGGEDHKTGHGDPTQAFEKLEQYARKYFQVSEISYRWSSQYYVPVDGLPYIGKLPGADENIYTATGFNGNGMILGTLSALILKDIILQKQNQYADLLSPSRLKPVAGFTEFVKENADVAYHFVADRFSAETIDSISKINNGEAKIISYEGEKLAIYKDENGKVTALSPVCTHAGCIVSWNVEEKTWDCPCHGGRFSITGDVLAGPPSQALQQINLTKAKN